jgi:hypothetical protein
MKVGILSISMSVGGASVSRLVVRTPITLHYVSWVPFGVTKYFIASIHQRRFDSGDIQATQHSKTECEKGSHGGETQADAEALAEEDEDRPREASGENQESKVASFQEKVTTLRR